MGGDPATDAIYQLPGVADLGPWVLIAVLLAPKLLDWYREIRGQQKDVDVATANANVSLEIEKIRGEFERQKDFQDDLIAECQRLRDECKQLRDHNYALSGSVMERDAIIRERDETIGKMQLEIDKLRAELDVVKRHVKAIEADRDKIKRECPVVQEEPKE